MSGRRASGWGLGRAVDGVWVYVYTAPQNGQKRFPKISTIAYEPEGRVLQNEVYLAKFLGANFEIWEP